MVVGLNSPPEIFIVTCVEEERLEITALNCGGLEIGKAVNVVRSAPFAEFATANIPLVVRASARAP